MARLIMKNHFLLVLMVKIFVPFLCVHLNDSFFELCFHLYMQIISQQSIHDSECKQVQQFAWCPIECISMSQWLKWQNIRQMVRPKM